MRLRPWITTGMLLVSLAALHGCSQPPEPAVPEYRDPITTVQCGVDGFMSGRRGESEVILFNTQGHEESRSVEFEGSLDDLSAAESTSSACVMASQSTKSLLYYIDAREETPRVSVLGEYPKQQGDLILLRMSSDGSRVCVTRLASDGTLRQQQIRDASGAVLWQSQQSFTPVVNRLSFSAKLDKLLLHVGPISDGQASTWLAGPGGTYAALDMPEVAFVELSPDGESVFFVQDLPDGTVLGQELTLPDMKRLWLVALDRLPSTVDLENGRTLTISWEGRTDLGTDGSQDSHTTTSLTVLDSGGQVIETTQHQGDGPWLADLSPSGEHLLAWPMNPANGSALVWRVGSAAGAQPLSGTVSGAFGSGGSLVTFDQSGKPHLAESLP